MTSAAATEPRTDRDPRPTIELPREGLPLPLSIGIILLLGLGLFLYLNARRQAAGEHATEATAMHLPAPPPPLLVPPPELPMMQSSAAPARAVVEGVIQPRQVQPIAPARASSMHPAPMPPAVPMKLRGNDPAMVIDLTAGNGAQVNGAAPGDAAAGDEAVRATIIRNRASIIPQGAIVAAVLETPLNSDRPGLARAIVSHDVRGFDGSRVLIPRGSRLIGEFKADKAPGLRRVLVTWTRLIRPDGVAIRIGSPVTDALGGAGAPGRVDFHFAERFASAVLQSALTIGVNVASQLPVNNGALYVGLPGQMGQIGQQLAPNTSRPPTVKVREGAQIAVLVARDLDFGGTPAVR